MDVGAWTYGEHVPEQACASSSSLWGANNPLQECNLGRLSMDQIANPGRFYEIFAPQCPNMAVFGVVVIDFVSVCEK